MSRLGSSRPPELPAALPEFAAIRRFWDPTRSCVAAKILPGEYYVTAQDEYVGTVLGSCVSACIRDLVLGIGGMNHFMLPHGDVSGSWAQGGSAATRFGGYAMESLINAILKHGGQRARLETKLFGGGQMLAGMSDVGARNIDFVRKFIEVEALKVSGEDLGGIYPRKLLYFPQSGKVLMKKLQSMHNNTILEREQAYRQQLSSATEASSIELF